jgi:hypothetical protein
MRVHQIRRRLSEECIGYDKSLRESRINEYAPYENLIKQEHDIRSMEFIMECSRISDRFMKH